MPQNRHTIALFQYIAFAPEEVMAKYCNGYKRWLVTSFRERVVITDDNGCRTVKFLQKEEVRENNDWYLHENNSGDSSFNGLLFRDNRVYVFNINIYEGHNNYKQKYLDITEEFDKLLKRFNIYHLCLMIPMILKKFYREHNLTENLLPYIETDDERLLPKFRYKIQSNHSRHRKFIEDTKGGNRRNIWDKVLSANIDKISNIDTLEKFKRCRPSLFLFDLYTEKPRIHRVPDRYKQSEDISKGIRKQRTFSLGLYPAGR